MRGQKQGNGIKHEALNDEALKTLCSNNRIFIEMREIIVQGRDPDFGTSRESK